MPLLKLKDIHKTYHHGGVPVPVLRGISLEIEAGEMVAIMGASGSGKTTLMNTLGCLDRPSAGGYWLDGEDVAHLSAAERAAVRSNKIGFVFQTFNLLPRTAALDNVIMPLAYAGAGLRQRECRERARTLLERMGLGDRLNYESSQLSGGQQQRVAIARALVNRPALLLADEPTGNLDSHTSEELLQMFQRLNAEEGITIVLVTHDLTVARHARRIVSIRDGIIEDDRPVQTGGPAPPLSVPSPRPVRREGAARGLLQQARFLIGILAMARRALRRNVLRSALTMLGIIIGVSAVIATIEIGQGASAAIKEAIASMGANTLMVLPGTASSAGVSLGPGTLRTLLPSDAEAIHQECPAVHSVAPVLLARTQVVYGNSNWVPQYIYGTTPSFLDVREWDVAAGQTFQDRDVRNGNQICLLGQTVARQLFGTKPPVGKDIRIQHTTFKVMGILGSKGANMMGVDQDDIVVAPWTTVRNRVSGAALSNINQSTASSGDVLQRVNTLSQLYPRIQQDFYPQQTTAQQANTPLPIRSGAVDLLIVRVASAKQTAAAAQQITSTLRARHLVRADQPNDFYVHNLSEVAKALAATVRLLAAFVLGVALISLMVGGVGIMNIMLVSVTERTREIGIRLAVGARAQDVLWQFLAEAVVLCLLGGAVGIAVGRTVSFAVWRLLHWPTEMSLIGIMASVSVSVTVGILFGYYPAYKASRMDPIHALRYE